jgi:hypothetical protein
MRDRLGCRLSETEIRLMKQNSTVRLKAEPCSQHRSEWSCPLYLVPWRYKLDDTADITGDIVHVTNRKPVF